MTENCKKIKKLQEENQPLKKDIQLNLFYASKPLPAVKQKKNKKRKLNEGKIKIVIKISNNIYIITSFKYFYIDGQVVEKENKVKDNETVKEKKKAKDNETKKTAKKKKGKKITSLILK